MTARGWRRGEAAADIIVVVAATAAAGALFGAAFGVAVVVPTAIAVLVPAAALSVAHVSGARDRRCLVVAHLLLMLAGLLLAARMFTTSWPLSAALWAQVGTALRDGGWTLLAITLPAPARPDLLLVPAAMVWLASAAGVTLAQRRRGAMEAALPAIAVGVYALVLGGELGAVGVAALLVIGACVLFLLIHGSLPTRPPGRPGVGAVVAGVLVLAALPLMGALTAPVRQPVDLRTVIADQVDVRRGLNPIDLVASWRSTPERPLFRATGAPPGARWRLAVLDSYDDYRWSADFRFRPAGLGVGPVPLATAEATQSIEIATLDGAYLPALDRPVRLDGRVRAVDVETGVLLGPLSAGPRYTVVSALPRMPGPEELARLSPGAGTARELYVPARLLSVLPMADRSVGAYAAARGLVERLGGSHPNVRGSTAGGTSIRSIVDFLRPGGHGTPVEFAGTVALAMRAIGVPTRLVTGFVPDNGRPGEIRGADATVWVELKLAGAGWVTLLATPPETTVDVAGAPPPALPPPVVDLPPPPAGGSSTGPDPPGPDLRPLRWIPVALACAAAAYICAVLCLPALRRWRRRHRVAAADRVAGAWHDVLESMPAAARPAYLTPSELVGRLEPVAAGEFAAIVNRALFSAEELSPEDARVAWDHATGLRKTLRRRQSLPRRIGWMLLPHNLRISLRYQGIPHRSERSYEVTVPGARVRHMRTGDRGAADVVRR